MSRHIKSFIFIFIYLLSNGAAFASEYVPEVYTDDYITVRSGISEAGRQPVMFGDRLSLIIEAEYPANEVITENLDAQLFERSWGTEKGVSLMGEPELTLRDNPDGTTTVRGTYNFQVLDCPGDLTSCRGNKLYELPIFTLGYQIIDQGGNVLNNKSVRFTPVPGLVVVMQALDIRGEGGLADLSDYLGNNGYPPAIGIPDDQEGSLWPLVTGGAIFLAGFFPLLLTRPTGTRRIDDGRKARHRWEKVFIQLENNGESMSDEEWSDMLRRCLTWYCKDGLGVNPYDWVSGVHQEMASHDASAKDFFIEVLNQEGVVKDQRSVLLNRFRDIAGTGA